MCVCVLGFVHAHHWTQSSRNNLTERLKPGEVNPVHFTTHTRSQMQNERPMPCFLMEAPLFTLQWTNWRWNENELSYHLLALPVKRLTSEQGHEITVMTHYKRMRDICHSCSNSGHKNALSLAWVSVLVESVIIGKQNQEKPPEDCLRYITTCSWFISSTKDLNDFSLWSQKATRIYLFGHKNEDAPSGQASKGDMECWLYEYNPTIWVTLPKGNKSRNLHIVCDVSGQIIQSTEWVF